MESTLLHAKVNSERKVGDKTIGDYLIERLHANGVNHIFGIPGDYVITLYEQMRVSGLVKPVNTVDEQGSGFAADSYARVRGLGAVCQTYGVGGLKALHTTAEAFTERSPVVVISGAPGLKEREKGTLLHHLIDGYYTQLKMFEEVTVASTILENPAKAFQEIDRVISAALFHQRPVYIEIPRDQFLINGDPHHIPTEYRQPGSNLEALDASIQEAVNLINKAKQPVIWAGSEIQRYGYKDKLATLLDATNIPFATTILGKAVLSELHPLFMGVYQGGLSPEGVRNYVESSDCILMLGTILTDVNLGLFTAKVDSRDAIYVSSEETSIQGRVFEQVQLGDFIDALTNARITPQVLGDIPRPVTISPATSGNVFLQSSTGDVLSVPMGESDAGRLNDNGIQIDDPSVSRKHARIKRESNSVWITDLGSSNGTFVNDSLLPPNVSHQLGRGDEIGFGRRLTYSLLGPVSKNEEPPTQTDSVDPHATVMYASPINAGPTGSNGSSDSATPVFSPFPGRKITSGRMFEAVNAFIDENTIISADNGETLIAGVDLLIHCDEGFYAPGYYTSVGFAVPIAMGAQLADPSKRPLVLVGDAAFQMTGVELSTMVRFGLNPIVVVMNNGGYGSERPLFDETFVDVHKWDYTKFIDVLGSGKGIKVETEDQMEIALMEAKEYKESLVIIDVHLEKFDYSPAFARFLELFAKGV